MSQGKTLDEALENIKDAIKGWLFVEEVKGVISVYNGLGQYTMPRLPKLLIIKD